MEHTHTPVFYRLSIEKDLKDFEERRKVSNPTLFDSIKSQLVELLICRDPRLKMVGVSEELVNKHLEQSETDLFGYGVWVYYPWKNQLVHILDEEEFIEVRTNRNKYKITQEEQEVLRQKKIGIAGLSVGKAIAATIALERIAGEIRLADFDEIELSNLNRINTSLTEMGMNKAISAAREISELDPYIVVKCYVEGLNNGNMNSFFTDGGKLDLFVEECDNIEIKIKSRIHCRKLGIPVVMETNDNCIVDIERFDIEHNREILHGRLEGLYSTSSYELVESNRLLVLQKMFDIEDASQGMKDSIMEIGHTIVGLPQLGSEVVKGAGVLAMLINNILLGGQIKSCRLNHPMKK